MLSQRFSTAPQAKLISKSDALALIPLTSDCEPSSNELIYCGIAAQDPTTVHELWLLGKSVSRGVFDHQSNREALDEDASTDYRSYWSKTDDVICVAHYLSERDCEQIESSTHRAYLSIFEVLKTHGFMHPFRFWNYLPDINKGEGEKEVYKRFCSGRLRAFEDMAIPPSDFPAASALGHHGNAGVIYAFASAQAPLHFKNNKQVNAYQYPPQYGKSSPSFARATALSLSGQSYLFISGTASIIGHQTVKQGDLIGQLEVTMQNIEYLLETANPDNKSPSTFKVYVRHLNHVADTKQWLEKHYPEVDTVITLADICRSDLLVEIECFCR